MADIKAGDVVCIKTTGEHVFVRSFVDDIVNVRRPKLSRDGIEHLADTFHINELETIDDHTNREVSEALKRLEAQKMLMNAKVKALASQDAAEPEEIDDEDGGPTFLPN